MQRKYTSFAVSGLFVLSLFVLPLAASAQAPLSGTPSAQGKMHNSGMLNKKLMRHGMYGGGVMGKVTARSGTTITLAGRNSQTYTIDASQAKFSGGLLGTSAESIGVIQVGDMIGVRGSVSGANVTAKGITDFSLIERTVFSGKVTAVQGTTIALAGRNGTNYSVLAGGAKLTKGFGKNQTAILITDVKVGDRVTVIGTLSGTTVSATALSDMGTPSFTQKALKLFEGKKKTS